MNLQLTTEQASELRGALELYLQELEFEIARTEQKEFRHVLRHTADCLDDIRRRLVAAAAAEGGTAYA